MTGQRHLHTAIAVIAGVGLAAMIFGDRRLATGSLILVVAGLVISFVSSLEALRRLANREKRP